MMFALTVMILFFLTPREKKVYCLLMYLLYDFSKCDAYSISILNSPERSLLRAGCHTSVSELVDWDAETGDVMIFF